MRGGDRLRRFPGGGGESRQGFFVAGDEGEDAGEKAGLRRRRAQRGDLDPGQGEKTRQQLGIAGEEAERRDGERLGLMARNGAWRGAHGHGKAANR